MLAALRWSFRWAAVAAPLALVADRRRRALPRRRLQRVHPRRSPRATAAWSRGGLELAQQRPLYGYGSASFSKEFAAAEDVKAGETTSSHNEPVTVAAEQGAIGIVGYLALLAAALWTLFSGMRAIAPGLGARFRSPPPLI